MQSLLCHVIFPSLATVTSTAGHQWCFIVLCFIVLFKPYGCNGPYVVISLILVLQQPVVNRYYANTPFYSCVLSCQAFEQE